MKLRKSLLILSAGAILSAAVIAPDVALAQPFPGPPPGGGLVGPPGPGVPPGHGAAGLPRPPGVGEPMGLARPGGPPGSRAAGLPRPSGAGGGRSVFSSGQGSAYGGSEAYVYRRAGTHGYGRAANYGYGRSGYGSWRHRYWAPYGVYVYSNSNSSGCYYADEYSSRLRAYRRVRVCSEE